MKSFLEEVVSEISARHVVNDKLVLVVPSKRAGLFLLQLFAKSTTKPTFAPTILTIEEFVSSLSGLSYAGNTQLLFELYRVYSEVQGQEAEAFHEFSKWGGTLLQDFNEIDRYLIPQKQLFSYLSAIQETDHWYLKPEKTPLIEAYLKFWDSLEPLYDRFSEHLTQLNIGYQGLVYRKASEAVGPYAKQSDSFHVFIGFNALNAAESAIVQTLFGEEKAEVFWDIDPVFLEDPIHDAGLFIRSYLKNWKHLSPDTLKTLSRTYHLPKKIRIVGVPRSVSQAKYVGTLLDKLTTEGALESTAVVLGDEHLLNPILNSIPPSLGSLNITMGLPLSQTPVASLFNEFISLYVNKQGRGWYHQDLLSLISHPYVKGLFQRPETTLGALDQRIKEKNWIYLERLQLLRTIDERDQEVFQLLFSDNYSAPISLLNASVLLIKALKEGQAPAGDALAMEYLAKMESIFNEIRVFLLKYTFITDLKSFQSLFRELMGRETMDFYGKPLEGVQLMGMLESRNLDFETVIITSVNEGILPSGKSHSSFIPFDMKKEFKMPTYKEKDAVYTYHFYRLLQRAKHVYLLYNTEPDVLEGGERSRLISQLLAEGRKEGSIEHIIASAQIKLPAPVQHLVGKDATVIEKLKLKAEKGFSPSALGTYIRNPIEFYKKYVLEIPEPEEVEENIAANTFGTIIHASLENLYSPWIGSRLEPDRLKARLPDIPGIVRDAFAKHYPDVSLDRGKNLIAFQVIQKYLENYLKMEIRACTHHQVELDAVEVELKIPLVFPELPFPIYLKGTIDRVDRLDGVLRILDYKTGTTKKSDVEVSSWEDLIQIPEKGKAFQMLCYALMYHHQHPEARFEAGIVPFRSLDQGIFQLRFKDQEGESNRTTLEPDTLQTFKEQLKALLLRLFDLQVPFEERID